MIHYFERNRATTGTMEMTISGDGDAVTFEAYLSDTVAPSATIEIYGTVAGIAWTLIATLNPSGALGVDSATPEFRVRYQNYKAVVTALSGVDARVSCVMGV